MDGEREGEWMDGWMDGYKQMNEYIYICIYVPV